MNQGLKNYTKQFSHEVSGVGTLLFNMCGGAKNMHMVLPLINTVGQNPISLSLIYNEIDKDEEGQFGKGFKLNTYQKLTYMTSPIAIAAVKNADGSVDNYVPATNEETGYTLSYEQIEDVVYGYFLKDKFGNEILLDTVLSHPIYIKNMHDEKITFDNNMSTLNNIQNEYGDSIVFSQIGNTVGAYYRRNEETICSSIITMVDSRITNIKYYEGTNILLNEISISYESNCIKLKNEISHNITKVENGTTNIYKIYDGFMVSNTESFLEEPDYTITYETMNESSYNKTKIEDRIGNYKYYYFNDQHLLDGENNKKGTDNVASSIKYVTYDKTTKELISSDNEFVKEENNPAKDLYFPILGTGLDNDFGIVGPPVGDTQPQTAVSEIYNKLTYYKKTTGRVSKSVSLSGEAGDVVTFSFFMASSPSVSEGPVTFAMSVGGTAKMVTFKNSVSSGLELHSMSVVAKQKFSSVGIIMELNGTASCRVGAYTLSNRKFHSDYEYLDNQIKVVKNGDDIFEIKYDENTHQPIEVLKNENNILTYSYEAGSKLVKGIKNEYDTRIEYEYDETYKRNVVGENLISVLGSTIIGERREYDEDGRHIIKEYDEFEKSTQYQYDSLGRIIKVTDALNNVLERTYVGGLLDALHLNSMQYNKYYYDARKRLEKVKVMNDNYYEFVYNDKNQIEQVKLNGEKTMQYSYDDYGNVIKQQYGENGDYFDIVYDLRNRIYKVYYNATLKYIYEYDNEDKLEKITDRFGTTIKSFVYDENDKLVEVKDYQNSYEAVIKNEYDKEDKVIRRSVSVNDESICQSFDDFSRSHDVSITGTPKLKIIGFSGTNIESSDQILDSFDIYPLHNDVNSLKGNKASVYSLKELGNNPFLYSGSAKKYCFEPSKCDLAYEFGNSTVGTIAFRAYPYSGNENNVLLELKDTNGDKISIKFVTDTTISLFLNDVEVESLNEVSCPTDTWNTIVLSYNYSTNADSVDTLYTRNFRLKVNNFLDSGYFETDSLYSAMTSFIGCDSACSNNFDGQLEMLVFKNAYCENSTINSLESALNIVSTKTCIDEFQRITSKEVHKNGVNIISNTYDYLSSQPLLSSTSISSFRVGTETIKGGTTNITTRTYVYDDLGRVEKIEDSVFGTKEYVYNARGFLENDNDTIISYNTYNNISSYGSTSFEYDSIRDKLKNVNGTTILYDQTNILNPSSYGNYNYSFEGKRLSSINNSVTNLSCSYMYNEQGLRISKEVNDVITEYFYDGDRLVTEISPSNRLDFLYDEQGLLFGFILNRSNKYFYVRDILLNILGLVDESGTLVVKYDYNAFGKILSVTDTSGVSIGTLNPFRYKGYYYDVETGLAMVGQRYYSPELCRFLQVSDISNLNPQSINGLNLYAYANNNPISFSYNNSSSIGSNSVGGGLVSSSGAGSIFSGNVSSSSTSKGGLNLGWMANGLDAGSTIHGLYTSISGLVNHTAYFAKNLAPFADDMTMLGASMKDGVLAFNQFSWGLGKSDVFGIVLGVGLDIYDSIQRGVSPGGVVLGATLTAAKGVGLIYLNKGIMYGATAIGSCFGPVGTVVGFVVGGVVCIVVDIFASNWLDDLIDKIAK